MAGLPYTERVGLDDGESCPALGLASRTPGEYLIKVDNRPKTGILSTLFLQSKDVGASITVSFHDFTLGEEEGEESNLGNHNEPAAGDIDRFLLTRAHNKPFIRVVVAGGSVEFSLYLSSIASGISLAAVKEGQDANTPHPFGSLAFGYDRASGKYHALNVGNTGVIQTQPTSWKNQFESSVAVLGGATEDLFTAQAFPGNETLESILVGGDGYGEFVVKLNSDVIAKVRNSYHQRQVSIPMGGRAVTAADTITVEATNCNPSGSSAIFEGFVYRG